MSDIGLVKCCRFCIHGRMGGMDVECKKYNKSVPVFSICSGFNQLTDRNNRYSRQINYWARTIGRYNTTTSQKMGFYNGEALELQDESL